MLEGQNCGLRHAAAHHEERKRKHQQFLSIGWRKGHRGLLSGIELDRRLEFLAGLSDAAGSNRFSLTSDALGRRFLRRELVFHEWRLNVVNHQVIITYLIRRNEIFIYV